MCESNKRKFIPKEPPLDYDRQIKKSYEKKKRQSRSSSSDVPKLRAQKKQTIETLIVERTQQQDLITFLKESNLMVAQVAGGQDIPKAQVVTRWKYKMGTSLVPRDIVAILPTQMRRLHEQYMLAMSQYLHAGRED